MAGKKQRNDYKGDAARLRSQKQELERKLRIAEEKCDADKKAKSKWWSTISYCENCEHVLSITCSPGTRFVSMTCAHCGVSGMCHRVRETNV